MSGNAKRTLRRLGNLRYSRLGSLRYVAATARRTKPTFMGPQASHMN